ncbi:MAG: transposase [Desulfitobacterium hafniense]|nr:transposase [Desulfitobacterium hafniense]
MLINTVNCISDYVTALNSSLKQISTRSLTKIQSNWLVFMLIGLMVTGCFSWAGFMRGSLGKFDESRLRWMFHYAKIAWNYLLQASVTCIIAHYGVTRGVLVLDDSDKVRSRNTSKIPGVHKIIDKKTKGWFKGQEFVFLLLVTDILTIPIGFRFYVPDPALKEWKERLKAQKKEGIPKKERAKKPAPSLKYPTKQMLALELLREFCQQHPNMMVQSVLADALYGSKEFMDEASLVTHCSQVISQLRKNQLVRSCGKRVLLEAYFARQPGVKSKLTIRGGESKSVTVLAARIIVKSHEKKRFVVALKYEGETEYRFIVATDLSWQHMDIARTYTLRWLVEVFIQDWKAHGGWNKLSKQQGVDGAMRGMTLSLLCEHALLLHPQQSVRFKNKKPGISTGCLIQQIKGEALLNTVTDIVNSVAPKESLEGFKLAIEKVLPMHQSKKHMVGRDLGRMEASPSLKYKKAA